MLKSRVAHLSCRECRWSAHSFSRTFCKSPAYRAAWEAIYRKRSQYLDPAALLNTRDFENRYGWASPDDPCHMYEHLERVTHAVNGN
jgi:hypothetical protein